MTWILKYVRLGKRISKTNHKVIIHAEFPVDVVVAIALVEVAFFVKTINRENGCVESYVSSQ